MPHMHFLGESAQLPEWAFTTVTQLATLWRDPYC